MTTLTTEVLGWLCALTAVIAPWIRHEPTMRALFSLSRVFAIGHYLGLGSAQIASLKALSAARDLGSIWLRGLLAGVVVIAAYWLAAAITATQLTDLIPFLAATCTSLAVMLFTGLNSDSCFCLPALLGCLPTWRWAL
nr:YgjV family protein [Ferrimonas marina]